MHDTHGEKLCEGTLHLWLLLLFQNGIYPGCYKTKTLLLPLTWNKILNYQQTCMEIFKKKYLQVGTQARKWDIFVVWMNNVNTHKDGMLCWIGNQTMILDQMLDIFYIAYIESKILLLGNSKVMTKCSFPRLFLPNTNYLIDSDEDKSTSK